MDQMVDWVFFKIFHIMMWMLLEPEGHSAFWVFMVFTIVACLIMLSVIPNEREDK